MRAFLGIKDSLLHKISQRSKNDPSCRYIIKIFKTYKSTLKIGFTDKMTYW